MLTVEPMDIQETRIARLKALVDHDGGPAAFARARSQASADKPINETYVSQLLNRSRNFGEKAARSMEKRAGLPKLYFDGADVLLDGLEVQLVEMYRAMPEVFKDLLLGQANQMLAAAKSVASVVDPYGAKPLPPPAESKDDPT